MLIDAQFHLVQVVIYCLLIRFIVYNYNSTAQCKIVDDEFVPLKRTFEVE